MRIEEPSHHRACDCPQCRVPEEDILVEAEKVFREPNWEYWQSRDKRWPISFPSTLTLAQYSGPTPLETRQRNN